MAEQNPMTRQRRIGAREAEYIRLTDLAKLRIARDIVYDVRPSSLPEKQHVQNMLYAAILKLMELEDDG